MEKDTYQTRKRLSLKIILSYTLVGAVWLIASDMVISRLSVSDSVRNFLELLSNLLFVTGTSMLFLYSLNRYLHHLHISQKALKKSEQRLRTLINTIPDFVILRSVDGTTLEANQAAHDFFEMKSSFVGKQMDELAQKSEIYNSIYQYCLETDKITLANQHIQRFEHVVTRHGQTQILEVTKVPVMHKQELTESILVLGKNITARKQVEDELRMTKNRLENFIRTSSDAILFYDIDGTILRVNQAFEQMYGWSEAEIIGQKTYITVPPQYKKEAQELYHKLKAGEHITAHETMRQKKDGTLFHVSISFSPIKNSKGEVVSVSGIIRDITERKKSEELLRKSEMLSVIGQLAAGVAHEIRNPLTALKGFVQLSKIEQTYNEAYTEIILSELERINTIVNEFMVLAKPQAMSFQYRSLNKLLREVVTIIGTQAILHNVEIVEKLAPDLPDILCEENQLKQVFINVLKNSIEAMPKGGSVVIETERKDQEYISITVTDQGQGIPPERIKRLGEPFYTTKEKGTGLGLMVSYKIIRYHQGLMEIESELGAGTSVRILLPLKQEETI